MTSSLVCDMTSSGLVMTCCDRDDMLTSGAARAKANEVY